MKIQCVSQYFMGLDVILYGAFCSFYIILDHSLISCNFKLFIFKGYTIDFYISI